MPKNANVLMVRHAEKPASGNGLAVAGQERAQAYAVYFQNYAIGGSAIKLNYLFAAADSDESHRPKLTITPLSEAIGLSIDAKHKDKDYAAVANDILGKSKYDNSNILICWHHGEILALGKLLLGSFVPSSAPPTNWPDGKKPWPENVYGWLLQISFGSDGSITSGQTFCINEQLMYDDYGLSPPNA
jgi:hypothetical protein